VTDSLPLYILGYGSGEARQLTLTMVLCESHLARRLSSNPPASILEKRHQWPGNEPCSDCAHERTKGTR